MNLNSISANVIHAAISVHRELGPGLFESVYQDCMLIELENLGMRVQGEVPLPVVYKGQKIRDEGFRIDLIVEDLVIVELKSLEVVQPVHKKFLRAQDTRLQQYEHQPSPSLGSSVKGYPI